MIYIVSGSRDPEASSYADLYQAMRLAIERSRQPPTQIFVGDATGVDALTVRWARNHNVPAHVFRADWSLYGRAAGPIRNAAMITETRGRPALLVALPGAGPGTPGMMLTAARHGLLVVAHALETFCPPPGPQEDPDAPSRLITPRQWSLSLLLDT